MILTHSTQPDSAYTSLPPFLSTRDMCMAYRERGGELRAIESVSFDVMDGEFLGVIGPSGCGKSTLLRILGGLLSPTKGELHFAAGRQPRVGMAFQDANLMPWRTVLRNVTLPLELMRVPNADVRARELIELVGLKGFEHKLPRQLSGGMAHRVAIACALVHDPDLTLLDEPFASLDALTRERMVAELSRISEARRKTVVMVTHSISEALYLADRVLVLTARPGTVKMDLAVDLPRPRHDEMRYDPKFIDMERQLRAELEFSG